MPPTTFRQSPSGTLVDASGGGAVESVFGRQGHVVAEPNDYLASQVDNDSTIPGATAKDALDSLSTSDGHTNESSVPGATVTDALDYLLANTNVGQQGALFESFSGGQGGTITTAANPGNVGDNAWNVGNSSSGTGWTITKIVVPGRLGVVRLTSPTGSGGAGSGPSIFLGNGNQNLGPFVAGNVSENIWKARFDPAPTDTNIGVFVGLRDGGTEQTGGLIETGFLVTISGAPPAGPNFFAWSLVIPGGFFVQDTGVPVDNAFHEFSIKRIVPGPLIEYRIDGVLVATCTDVTASPADTQPLVAVAYAFAVNSPPNGTTFLDIDSFQFVPA